MAVINGVIDRILIIIEILVPAKIDVSTIPKYKKFIIIPIIPLMIIPIMLVLLIRDL